MTCRPPRDGGRQHEEKRNPPAGVQTVPTHFGRDVVPLEESTLPASVSRQLSSSPCPIDLCGTEKPITNPLFERKKIAWGEEVDLVVASGEHTTGKVYCQPPHALVDTDPRLIPQVAAGGVDLEPVGRRKLLHQEPGQRRLGAAPRQEVASSRSPAVAIASGRAIERRTGPKPAAASRRSIIVQSGMISPWVTK